MARLGWVAGAIFALSAACGGDSKEAGPAPGPVDPPPDDGGGGQPVVVKPPIVAGDFTFYGTEQGLPRDIWDVSADEGGNVYVAGGDAVYAKKRDDADFNRFAAAAANLTTNCDAGGTTACPIISVAGAAPGVAIIGFKGIGTDSEADPDWQLDSGGADVLAFDGARLARTRHVHVAGVPEQMCDNYDWSYCPGDKTWVKGRRKVRQVHRVVVNHDKGAPQYGDVWMSGSHASFSLLVANPEARGWVDLTTQYPGTEDRRYVWEHEHPAPYLRAKIGGVIKGAMLTGDENTALAIDPVSGDPWASNLVRTATMVNYARDPVTKQLRTKGGWGGKMWPPDPWMDVWPDPDPATTPDFDALSPDYVDAIRSLSFCDDGTLWMASSTQGLARRAPDGTISSMDLPDGYGKSAYAVACDPSDNSIWVGFGWGGFGRYKDGRWSSFVDVDASPLFAHQSPVRNIQIDRWSSPRIVYFAHEASRHGPGGVTVYRGP